VSDAEQWLVDFFGASGVDAGDHENLLNDNYFDRELLDSLEIIRLIVGIEDRFAIKLDAQDMQDPRFCTIRGLAQIIDSKRKAA